MRSKDDMTFVSFNQAGKKPPRRRESQVSTTSIVKKGKNEEGAMIN
jgi:hypothetical protein